VLALNIVSGVVSFEAGIFSITNAKTPDLYAKISKTYRREAWIVHYTSGVVVALKATDDTFYKHEHTHQKQGTYIKSNVILYYFKTCDMQRAC